MPQMYSLPTAIVAQHNISFVIAAFAILIGGAYLTLSLFRSARATRGVRLYLWAIMAGIVGSGSFWTAQFLFMLGFDPGVTHGYIAGIPTKALVVGMLIMITGFSIAARARFTVFVELGGAIIGLGLCVMHSIALSSFIVEGRVQFDMSLLSTGMAGAIIASILLTNRAVQEVTSRTNRYLALSAMLFAFISIHVTTLLGTEITLIPGTTMPEDLVSNESMMLGVMSRLVSVMAIGLIAYALDYYGSQDVLERFRHLAHHDTLTGIPNRLHLNRSLDDVLSMRHPTGQKVAVLTFDLNRFKDINDVHTHSAGDFVLQTVAARLQQVIAQREFVARIGGDEFVAYKEAIHTKDQAKAFATKLKTAIIEGIEWNGRVLNVGSSIGISMYPDDGDDRDELIGKADLAMYRAKRTVSNGIAHYDAEMDEAKREKSAISIDVRHAIDRGEFELVYQPQHRVSDRQLTGFEVLLRWNHPERGIITPDVFIPIVERDGYIKIIGEWVLREACREAARWEEPLKIAVNVAASQLAGTRLPRVVREALVDAGLPAARLELEITESGIIPDPVHAEAIVRELKEIGVSIAMDDFGTGYSSLSTLQTFPFDKIKIDKAFVLGINSNPQSEAIVKSTVKLGDWLGISVLAEGVETEEHMKFLTGIGCGEVQGFLFGKPSSTPKHGTDDLATNVVRLRTQAS
jgi:diguanylate cyclase (GGDEF)-like protein